MVCWSRMRHELTSPYVVLTDSQRGYVWGICYTVQGRAKCDKDLIGGLTVCGG